MSDKKYPEWMTIRIRGRVVKQIDEAIEKNNAAHAIPAKTNRSDVIEAALRLYNEAQVVAESLAPVAPKKRAAR